MYLGDIKVMEIEFRDVELFIFFIVILLVCKSK